MFDPHSKLIKHVLSDDFPWYYPSATYHEVEAHYHLLLSRDYMEPKIVSEYFYPFLDIFDKFCKENDIKVNTLFGAALHQTLPSSKKAQKFHVDFHFPHNVLIMYLTDDFDAGRTLISSILKTDESPVVLTESLESEAIQAEKGKIICFDGMRYHAGEYPIDGRRVVCIFTFA